MAYRQDLGKTCTILISLECHCEKKLLFLCLSIFHWFAVYWTVLILGITLRNIFFINHHLDRTYGTALYVCQFIRLPVQKTSNFRTCLKTFLKTTRLGENWQLFVFFQIFIVHAQRSSLIYIVFVLSQQEFLPL